MAKKLTLEEIGKLAGVSRSTVSRVINNQPDVKDDVRERVHRIIHETGYVPNPAARSLASQRTGILGLVVPRSVVTFFGDPYFSRLTQGITRACYAHGYMLSLFLFYSKEDEQMLLPHIAQNSFLDGVIVQATTDTDPIIPQLRKSSMPFLVLGSLLHMPDDINYVDVDNVSGAFNAVTYLIEHGYRRIAHITGALDNRPAIDRRTGYEQALTARNIAVEPDLVAEGDFREDSGYSKTKELLAHQPDAIFAASDLMALGAVRAIKDSGLTVPGDIAVVGFDDLPPSRNCTPQISTVRQPIYRLGIDAVAILTDIIENGAKTPRKVIYDTELIIRESSAVKLAQ